MTEYCCEAGSDLEIKRSVSKRFIQAVAGEGRNLTESEAYKIIEDYGIPIPKYAVAKSAKEAANIGSRIGFPVVMKIISPDILHKSDVGGVLLGIASEEEAEKAYEEILKNIESNRPDAKVDGILVVDSVGIQKTGSSVMGKKDVVEVIIGGVKDPEFGFAVMFGLGGIFVEIAKDVSFRLVPVTRKDVLEMMLEINSSKILEGIRGRAPRDKEALADIVIAVSQLVKENPCITSIDLNPVLSFDRGACVVDAKITF